MQFEPVEATTGPTKEEVTLYAEEMKSKDPNCVSRISQSVIDLWQIMGTLITVLTYRLKQDFLLMAAT